MTNRKLVVIINLVLIKTTIIVIILSTIVSKMKKGRAYEKSYMLGMKKWEVKGRDSNKGRKGKGKRGEPQ